MHYYPEARGLSKLAEQTEEPGKPLQWSPGMPRERCGVGTEMAALEVVTCEVFSGWQARRSCSQVQSQWGTPLIPSSLIEPSYERQVFLLVLPVQMAEGGVENMPSLPVSQGIRGLVFMPCIFIWKPAR